MLNIIYYIFFTIGTLATLYFIYAVVYKYVLKKEFFYEKELNKLFKKIKLNPKLEKHKVIIILFIIQFIIGIINTAIGNAIIKSSLNNGIKISEKQMKEYQKQAKQIQEQVNKNFENLNK